MDAPPNSNSPPPLFKLVELVVVCIVIPPESMSEPVVWLSAFSVEFDVILFEMKLPPMLRFPEMPVPPNTVSAPVEGEVELIVDSMVVYP